MGGTDRVIIVSGGVKTRINGEQRASEATRCRAGHQEGASRQAASRLLRCAPALRVTCHNLLIRLAFMAGSQLPAVTDPFADIRRSRMSTPTSCVRQISALLRSHQHIIDGLDEISSAAPGSAVETVLTQLSAIGNPPFILSCREADWLGAADRAGIEEDYGEGRGAAAPSTLHA